MQTTSQILMIRPAAFDYNAQTAVNNAFQQRSSGKNIHETALKEFDAFVDKLRLNGVSVTVIQDTPEPHTPDAIFPNNWVSFHEDGTIILYPMFASNRQQERNKNVIGQLSEAFKISETIDFTGYENQNLFLEGTGSMVLDRESRIVYACISPRTDRIVLKDFCEKLGSKPVIFTATDNNGKQIYHTNVMMCVADRYVVICLESISDENEKDAVIESITRTRKTIVDISRAQMNRFAGNMLQVQSAIGKKLLVMSSQAFEALTPEQLHILESFNPIIHSPLNTIEQNGGGSARCMMAEVFLPLK